MLNDYKGLKLIASSNPHIRNNEDTRSIMLDVIIALCPALLMSVIRFGFRALIVVVVGGLGSIPGAFFAGIFLGLLEQMSALFISPSYSDMIVFVTFIIILVVRQVMILRRR